MTSSHAPIILPTNMLRTVSLVVVVVGLGALLSGATVLAVFLTSWLAGGGNHGGACTLSMFANKTGAFWACQAAPRYFPHLFSISLSGYKSRKVPVPIWILVLYVHQGLDPDI